LASQGFLSALVVFFLLWTVVGVSWADLRGALVLWAVIALVITRLRRKHRSKRSGAEPVPRTHRGDSRPQRESDHGNFDGDWGPDDLDSDDWDADDEWDEIEDHRDDDWEDRTHTRARGRRTRRPAWWDDDDDADWDDEFSRRPRRRRRTDSWESDSWDDDYI
jgi:hypothetical protein